MSHVTDIIIVTMLDDGGGEDCHPNVDLIAEKAGIWFEKASDKVGGNKAMQADVFLAAVNCLDIDNFVSIFGSVKWEYPDCVQLFLKDEHENVFTVYNPPNSGEY